MHIHDLASMWSAEQPVSQCSAHFVLQYRDLQVSLKHAAQSSEYLIQVGAALGAPVTIVHSGHAHKTLRTHGVVAHGDHNYLQHREI